MNKWEKIVNCESADGTWEITHYEENEVVELIFWDCENQGTKNENLRNKTVLRLTYEQADSLVKFLEKINT